VLRIEARGTPTTTHHYTQWHANYRLLVKITEPYRIIDFSSDPQGLLLERKETPTSLKPVY